MTQKIKKFDTLQQKTDLVPFFGESSGKYIQDIYIGDTVNHAMWNDCLVVGMATDQDTKTQQRVMLKTKDGMTMWVRCDNFQNTRFYAQHRNWIDSQETKTIGMPTKFIEGKL